MTLKTMTLKVSQLKTGDTIINPKGDGLVNVVWVYAPLKGGDIQFDVRHAGLVSSVIWPANREISVMRTVKQESP